MSQSFSIQKSISVEVPIWRAYGCWRRAENFPQFMDTVLEVKQMAKNQLCWVENIDGQEFQTLVENSAFSCNIPEPNHWDPFILKPGPVEPPR
jgi:uncharacterized membrane protein